MEKDSKFLLNKQSIKLKAVYNETTVTNSSEIICTLKSISLIPVSASVKPLTIKENFTRKSDVNKQDIETKLYEGLYYLNVVDYSLGEIVFAANLYCNEWCNIIWNYLLANPKKDEITISLKDSTVKEYILEANPEHFETVKEIDIFCQQYGISINDLIQTAKFSQLEIQLETVSARLSSEIFFFRTKLFTELLIQKINQKIYSHLKKKLPKIPKENISLYDQWKDSQLEKINAVQRYIQSPFTFDDKEQYFNFESIQNFIPKNNLPQDLLSETFYWVDNFPKVKERFKRAVELFKEKGDMRDCLDNLRLSLELLIKKILNNDKSLEKQLSEIGKYQEQLGIGIEIRNTFVKTIDYFSKYQNNNVKHNVKIKNIHEVEFIFGLTMIFIRMLIKPNDQLHKDVV